MMNAMQPDPRFVQHAEKIAAETAALQESNQRRLNEINARGKMVGGLDSHLLESLLEMILTPEMVALAHLNHERWLAETLTEIESNLRKQAITAPLLQQ